MIFPKVTRFICVFIVVLLPQLALAQPNPEIEAQVQKLQQQVEQMSAQLEEDELQQLVEEAEAVAEAPLEEQRPEDREFLWGALSLQKLNPELSFSADMVAGLVINKNKFYAGANDRSGMPVREVALQFQHLLDPYSLFKSSICFVPGEGACLEEVYITWFGLLDSISLSVGRFRQQFGVVNRWHTHDLDQVEYPLALRLLLGPDGITGNGVSFKWFMPPLLAHANELTLQFTDGENETLFSGEYFSVPTALLHLKNYYDVTENTYLELGLTGMYGFNNRRGLPDGDPPAQLVNEPWRQTIVAGADLTIHWSPLKRAKYESMTFRSEFYYVGKEQPESASDEWRHAWGFYSYLDYQLTARWFCGVRYDMALPTVRVVDEQAWGITPYLTFWQSEFVYLRLQYVHGQNVPYEKANGSLSRRVDNRVLFQIDFAAGPHKHEKY